ncbi:Vacuolar protease A [Podila horticola]|nr:Vacuolar protease A [Podila horticola]
MKISIVAGLASLAIVSRAAMLRIPIEVKDVPSIFEASRQNGPAVDIYDQLNFGAHLPHRNNDPTLRDFPTEIHYGAWLEGKIHLGTPPQQFTVKISTIGPYSYVLSKGCQVVGCIGQRMYDSTASSTYKENGTYFDLEGSVRGRISNDVLRIGFRHDSRDDDSHVIVIPDQDFGEATFDASCWIPYLGCGGFLGLGFSSDNDDDNAVTGVPPVLNWARQQKSKDDAVVGLYNSPDMASPGQITFGGLDRAHYIGELHWNALAKRGAWSAHLNRIVARTRSGGVERSVPMTDTPTLFSTMSNLLASLSLEQAKVVNEEILGGTEVDDPQSRGYYVLPCDSLDTLPSLSFVIGSEHYTFKASEYVQINESKGVKVCGSLISGSKMEQHLGLAFLRKYYVGLDIGRNRIGLAPAKMVI